MDSTSRKNGVPSGSATRYAAQVEPFIGPIMDGMPRPAKCVWTASNSMDAASRRSSDSNQPRSPAGISGFTSAAAWAATRSPSMTQNSVADAGGGGDGGLTRCG